MSGKRKSSRAPAASGRLRLIGGEFRRRLLPVPASPGLRPTPDRVRETLFNWLSGTLTSRTRALDLFAGTGALGLEALSRGAGEVVFVESDRHVARQIEANLDALGRSMPVIKSRAEAFLERPVASPFDLVFLDPPFRHDLAGACCQRLEAGGWLAEGAHVYLETEAELLPAPPAGWQLLRETRAGDSRARLYRRGRP